MSTVSFPADEVWHKGGCHCGAVRWEVFDRCYAQSIIEFTCFPSFRCKHLARHSSRIVTAAFVSVFYCCQQVSELTLGSKKGFLHLIVPAAKFRLVRGAADLTQYALSFPAVHHLPSHKFFFFLRDVSDIASTRTLPAIYFAGIAACTRSIYREAILTG
jgi:hypothetical protein